MFVTTTLLSLAIRLATCFWYILTSNPTLLGICSPRNLFRAPKPCMLGVSAFYDQAICWRHGHGIFVQQPYITSAIEAQALRLLAGSRDTNVRCQIGNKTHRTCMTKMGGTGWKTLPRRPGHLNRRRDIYCCTDVSLTIPCMSVRTSHSTCKYSFLHHTHFNSRPSYFADVWCQDKQRQRSYASTVAYRFSLYSELHPQIFFFPSASLGILQLSLLSLFFSFPSLDCVLMMAHSSCAQSLRLISALWVMLAFFFPQKVRKNFFLLPTPNPRGWLYYRHAKAFLNQKIHVESVIHLSFSLVWPITKTSLLYKPYIEWSLTNNLSLR